MAKLKVAVRVRPLSHRETEIASTSVITVLNEESLEITNIKVPEENVAGDSRERIRRFTFDFCFDENSTQNHIFTKIESLISESIRKRKHSCVLAYGQSSTGKTHTMMGLENDPGVIPNFCNKIFDYIKESDVGAEDFTSKVTVSYLEIYNEKVRDLLNVEENSLKIREHPKKGPYVPGLEEHHVSNSGDLLYWLERGNKKRKVAATTSNPQSSRSHSVFVVNCDGVKLNLIDLAGSERASSSRCFNIIRFKEGSNINKSIVALGNVISALAQTSQLTKSSTRRRFIPYRDSVLTWLLKDILGGNSNTVMIATVSPSSACYNETVNTLRFGQRAKNIVFRPVVVEDPKEKTIRNLRAEIFKLKELLKDVQLKNSVPIGPKDELIVLESTGEMNKDKLGNYSSDDSLQSSKSVASSSEKDSGQQTPSNVSASKPRGSLENIPKRAASTEQLSRKIASNKKPRSQVVAAVTSRLYNKTKRKDASTDTEDINGVLDLLSDTAKTRLREITRRALRAHRIKHQDTQTDFVPARRMKERGTDSRDLKIDSRESKHAETMTHIECKDAEIECNSFVNIFGEEEADRNFSFTRSCGTQFNKEEDRRVGNKPQAVMSFTKYLREVKEECNNEAIYTNVVNINISNHYNKSTSSTESLDLDQIHANSLVTPDLLSSHPALETSTKEVQTWLYCNVNELTEKFSEKTNNLVTDEFINYSKATCCLIPNYLVTIPSIKMLKSHVSQSYQSDIQQEYCIPLPDFDTPTALPNVIITNDRVPRDDAITITKPPTLQPIVTGTPTFKNIIKNKIPKCADTTQRMVSAMSVFLEEATDIISKFSEKIESRNNIDLELTVNGLDLSAINKKKKKIKRYKWDLLLCKEQGSQTLNPITYSSGTQADYFSLPVNKYEESLKKYCDRLENKLNNVYFNKYDDNDGDDTDDLLSDKSQIEGLSLDSNLNGTPLVYSDYGSLPKKKKVKYKSLSTVSPKIYLEQLKSLRKNIVEKTRSDL